MSPAGQKGWCNACNGVGRERPIETRYHVDEDDVREFVEFLEHCGGFAIH